MALRKEYKHQKFYDAFFGCWGFFPQLLNTTPGWGIFETYYMKAVRKICTIVKICTVLYYLYCFGIVVTGLKCVARDRPHLGR